MIPRGKKKVRLKQSELFYSGPNHHKLFSSVDANIRNGSLKNECSEHNPCITKLNTQSYRCNIAATPGNMFLETIFCLDAGEDERGSPVLSEIPSIYLVSSFTLSANDGLVLE